MSFAGRIVVAALALAALGTGRAEGADYCVGVVREGCTEAATLAAALGEPDRVRVFLGPGAYEGAFADGGAPVELFGAGPATLLRSAGLELTASASAVRDLRVEGPLKLAGRGERLGVRGAVTLLAGLPDATAALMQVVVEGTVLAEGPARLDGVDIDGQASPALDARCAAVVGRGVTVTGGTARAACDRAPPAAASLRLASAVVDAGDPFAVSGTATIETSHSAHADDPAATAAERIAGAFALGADRRPVAGSALVDAGDPAGLAPYEPFEDAGGDIRVTDGDGDGTLRRDAGAYELQPPPVPPVEANVLVDPGAEAADLSAGGPPPGWTGTFTAGAYGAPFLPSARAGSALGGGTAFFTAGLEPRAHLLQRIDVSASAQAIDGGGATAALAGLLGGYGADADTVRARAEFRDPEGAVLGTLELIPVTAAERGNATNLLARRATGPIPARTRAIDVRLHGERLAGAYTDAYADNLALELSVPGVPVEPPVEPTDPIVPDLKPFAGISVLTARPRLSRRWRAAIALACASATVGHCSGRLEMTARLPRSAERTRIAHYVHFSLAPGQFRTVTARVLLAARRALRARRTIGARLLAVARDGQGLQRERTVPLRLRLPRGR